MPNRDKQKPPLTKKHFEELVKKAAQPLPKKESVPKEGKTMAVMTVC